jgi:apolipoprotein N-acyltransferase
VICFRSLSFPLSLLTAGLLYLSYPGGGEWWPAVFVSLVPLLAAGCTEQKTSLHAFGAGLTCGIIHFMLLLYWLVTVLNQYGGLPWFLAWPGLFFLSLYMALYLALFVGIGRYLIRGYPPLVALFLLPALWVGIDGLSGFFINGFTWMDIG